MGESLALFLTVRVGRFGAVVVLGLSLFTGLILTTQFSFSAFLTSLVSWISDRITAARVGSRTGARPSRRITCASR